MNRWFNNCMANMNFLAQVRLRNATYGWCLYGAFISGKGKIGGGSGGGIDSSEVLVLETRWQLVFGIR